MNCRVSYLITIFYLIFGNYCTVDCAKSSAERNYLISSKAQCTQNELRKMEMKLSKLLAFGPNGRKFPDSLDKMKSFCRDTSRMLTQAEKFAKDCFRKDIANIAVVYVSSLRNAFVRSYCGKNIQRSTPLIELAPCLNEHFYPKDHCFKNFVNQTKQLVTIKNDALKIPHTCCNFLEMMRCIKTMIKSQPCLEQHREHLLDVIRGSTDAVGDMIVCEDYSDSSDRCDRLGKAPSPGLPNNKQYNSFILVLIDLLVSIDDATVKVSKP